MRYVLVETDYLIGLLFKEDKLHSKIREICRQYIVYLSPYSLLELHLTIISGNIIIRNIESLFENCDKLLKRLEINCLPSNSMIHAISQRLRREYNLSLFDSLHAATSIYYKLPLLSSDKAYEGIKELTWIDLRDSL